MSLPRIVVTGASGFVGRHLLEALRGRYRIYGLARRSQARCGAPEHPTISWNQVDIANRDALERCFGQIAAEGSIDAVIHLAAHYDFTGEVHREYWRTNVDGLRNILDICRELRPGRFIFSSSVAASRFPPPGAALDEASPADGEHVYAETKRVGETMLHDYRDAFPSTIVRFAALFSDWCEYPPLFVFLGTWLSNAWNRRMLGGRGESSVPYLHVRDAVSFLERLLNIVDRLGHGHVLICGRDGDTTHEELFTAATDYYFGSAAKPIHMPQFLCGPGMWVRDLVGRISGERPFERPWMARYIDQRLKIDGSKTRTIVGWEPRERLEICRRMPFLLDHLKSDPVEWSRRNHAAMKVIRRAAHLRVHALLEKHEEEISDVFTIRILAGGAEQFPSYMRLDPQELRWSLRVVLRNLMSAILVRQKSVFVAYCRDLAERRADAGFAVEEVVGALRILGEVAAELLCADPESEPVRDRIDENITMTLLFGSDQVQDYFEQRALEAGPELSPEQLRLLRLARAPQPGAAGELEDDQPHRSVPEARDGDDPG